ncbi:hypothetical protein P409_08215 [Inquilinus limosus MP06]|uniref:Capsule biosynthesis protein n=2 Tax=Inquilinus limosus TaxID=171674 RepID=A0A0A0DA84_9PROT|nr:hypothetical protein P409_08215 [Inquilinus limosus MP06]
MSNNYRTMFFEKIGRGLERKGVGIVWIAASRRWADALIKAGWRRDRILCLADFRDEWRSAPSPDPADPALTELEAGGLSANETILMDRTLNRRPHAKAYLAVVAREVSRFLKAHDVRAAFGEQTWAYELATALLCKAQGRAYFAPSTVRVPSDRFGFFTDLNQAEIFEIRKPDRSDREAAEGIIEALRTRAYRPYYFHIQNKIRLFRSHWLGESVVQAFSRATDGDETLPTLAHRSRFRFRRIANTYRTRWQKPFESGNLPGARPFVLVTLHMQPEASIDVFAHRNSDQIENVRALSRVIQHGWEIYVKEHSNAIGFRSPRYYDELRRIPGVRLIDPYADTFKLMEASKLVLSPSGTVCLEAGLLGLKAATFAPMYFTPVMSPGRIDLKALTRAGFERLLQRGDREGGMEPAAFLSWLYAQSFPGRVGDPVHDPQSMTEENVAIVVNGFATLLQALETRRQPNASAA